MSLKDEIDYDLSRRICDLEDKVKKQDSCELLNEMKEDIVMLINMVFDLSVHLGLLKEETEEEPEEEETVEETTAHLKRILQ